MGLGVEIDTPSQVVGRLLNSVIRSATKRRKLFPSDDSALKVIYLAISQAAKKWTMPIQNWRLALNRFMIEFGDRLQKYVH